jgi:hypothetical protein
MIELTWPAVPGSKYYQVFRGTSPDFTPNYYNLCADGRTDTSFADVQRVSPGTTYYYQVYCNQGLGQMTLVGKSSATTPAKDLPLFGTYPGDDSAQPAGDTKK